MSTAIVKSAPPESWALMGPTLDTALKFCESLVRSGLLPKQLDTAAKALVVILKGREMDIPPVYACHHIHVVNGKPGASGELMLALLQRKGWSWRWVRADENEATLVLVRPNGTECSPWTFNDAMARQAGLLGKDTWKNYKADMLSWRATSRACRHEAPAVIGGLSHTPEELGAEIKIASDGSVEVVSAAGEGAVSSGTPPNLPPPVKPSPPATDFQRKTLARLLMLKERNVDASCIPDALANYYDMEWDTLSAFDADAVIGLLRTKPDLAPEPVVLAEPPPISDDDLPFPDEPLASAPAASTSAGAVPGPALVALIDRNANRGKWRQEDGTIRVGKRLSERLEIEQGFYTATGLAQRCGSKAAVALLAVTNYQAAKK